jgi:hypothetical protein
VKQDCVVIVGPGQRLRYLEQEGAVQWGWETEYFLVSAAGALTAVAAVCD